jgi:hypothetical protein
MSHENKRHKTGDGDTIMADGGSMEDDQHFSGEQHVLVKANKLSSRNLNVTSDSNEDDDDTAAEDKRRQIRLRNAERSKCSSINPPVNKIVKVSEKSDDKDQQADKAKSQKKPEDKDEAVNPPPPPGNNKWAVYILKFCFVHIIGCIIPVIWTVLYPFLNNMKNKYLPEVPGFFSDWTTYAKRVGKFFIDFIKRFMQTESGQQFEKMCVSFWDKHGDLICAVLLRFLSTLGQQYVFFVLFLENMKCVKETTETLPGLSDDFKRKLINITTISYEPVKLTRIVALVNYLVWPLNILVIAYPRFEAVLWIWLFLFPYFGMLNLLGYFSDIQCTRRNLQIVLDVDFWKYFFGGLFLLF